MKFKEYKEQVKRTLPTLGSVILDSVHMVLGMCSEIYELIEGIQKKDVVNISEEITDIAWYASNYLNIRDINPITFIGANIEYTSYDKESSIRDLVLCISELQDYDKKELCYNKVETNEIKESRRLVIGSILSHLNVLYYLFGINCEQAMQNNINKLRTRFPDKFTEEKANNRDLLNERKQLEK